MFARANGRGVLTRREDTMGLSCWLHALQRPAPTATPQKGCIGGVKSGTVRRNIIVF